MIHIDEEFKALIPPLSADERAQLEANIIAEGCRDAIVTWQGVIVDGHNRHEICTRNNIDYRTVEREFATRDDVKLWIVQNQFGRRNLPTYERARLALVIKPIIAAKAKANEVAGGGDKRPGSTNLSNPVEIVPIDTREELSTIAGVSQGTIAKVERIERDAPAEVKQALSRGDISIDKAYQDMRRKEREEQAELEAIERSRMEALASTKRIIPLIICGRAEHCESIADASVDLIITSPPYNLGAAHWPMGGAGNTPREAGIGYDIANDAMEENEYQDWQIKVINEMWRVAKDGASFFYNHKVRHAAGSIIHPMDWLRKTLWDIRQEIIWDRGSTHNHSSTLFWQQDERIYWLTKGTPKIDSRTIGIPSVWRIPFTDVRPENNWHPAPFPIEIPETLIKIVTSAEAVVLDPFMGSGTTLIAATKSGRNSIGVEISSDYIEKVKRINAWET